MIRSWCGSSCYFLLFVVVIPPISRYFLEVCSSSSSLSSPPLSLHLSFLSSLFLPLVLFPPPCSIIFRFMCVFVCACVVVNSCSSYEVISHMVSVYFAGNGNCSLPKTPLSQLPNFLLSLIFSPPTFPSLISSLLLFHPPLCSHFIAFLLLLSPSPILPPYCVLFIPPLIFHPPLSNHFFRSLHPSCFPFSLLLAVFLFFIFSPSAVIFYFVFSPPVATSLSNVNFFFPPLVYREWQNGSAPPS